MICKMNRLYMFDDFENLKKHNLQNYVNIMPVERIKKYNQYSNDKNKLNCLASYLLLWLALKQNSLIKNPPSFTYGSNKKPYIKENNSVFFNISHTNGCVICAISNNEIGVDIEKIRPINLNISKKICTPSEQKLFDKSSNKANFLLKIWTKKESYIKMKSGNIFSDYSKIDTTALSNIYCFKHKNFIISLSAKKYTVIDPIETSTSDILSLL